MRYVIAEHDGEEYQRDRNRYRAFFYWREGETEQRKSYSIEQLEEQIRHCRERGEPTTQLEAALKRLRSANA